MTAVQSIEAHIHDLGHRAKVASRALARLSSDQKNAALLAMADQLEADAEPILAANAADVTSAEEHGLTPAMIDRLKLTPDRICKIANDIRDVAGLPDPVGEAIRDWTRPNGIAIRKVRVPIGVIGIIYESRPNVTSDAAVLCIKTGNAVILRGGSESIHSNLAIAAALQSGGQKAGLPADSILLVADTDRAGVVHMAEMDRFIDMIVPRGGHALIEAVVKHARMPVIKHYHGVCHVYVDSEADLEMAVNITINAKCQRPGVCNSLETLLVHRGIAPAFLEKCGPALIGKGVELRGDTAACELLGEIAIHATEEDWSTEYLDLILSVSVVDGLTQAVDHIETYGSHHSDAIVTENEETAEEFLAAVDSATVYWNASTRFTDGAEFGFGAEIGISTDKLHARGPMALEELTTYKYTIRGSGQIKG